MKEQVIICDIETRVIGSRPDPLRDELVFVGFMDMEGNSIMFHADDKEQIQYGLTKKANFIVGHNFKEYDAVVLKRAGFKIYPTTIIDTYDIIKKRAKPMMYLDFAQGQMSLRYLAEYFGLDSMKGDIDYDIFKQYKWTDEEIEEIMLYLDGDLRTTKALFKYLYDFFIGFKEFVSDKDKDKMAWLTASAGSTAYKVICNMGGIQEEYVDVDDDDDDGEVQYKGGFVALPTDEVVLGEDVYCADWSSLYPHMFMGGNLYSPIDEGGWTGGTIFRSIEDGDPEGLQGMYSRTRGKIEQVIFDLYNLRVSIKQSMKMMTKGTHEYTTADARQLATKIIINTIYGISGSRIFKNVFSLITAADCTAMARQSIKHARSFLTDKGFRCVYTDSVGGESTTTFKNRDGNVFTASFDDLWDIVEIDHIDLFDNGKERAYIVDGSLYTQTMADDLTIIYKPVLYLMRHVVDKQCYYVKTNSTNGLVVTEDHSLINLNHNTQKLVEVSPLKAKHVILNSGVTLKNERTRIDHAAEMLGYWIGDGSYSGEYYINFAGGLDAAEFKEKCLDHVVEMKDRNLSFNDKGDFKFSDIKLRTFMESIGFVGTSKTKRIPAYIMSAELDYKLSFLRGMFSSDGTAIKGSKTIRYTTVNMDLANDLKLLLASVGIGSTIIVESNTNEYDGVDSGTYSKHIRISSLEIPYFLKNIGFIFDRKQEVLIDYVPFKRYASVNCDVTPIDYTGYVYDIEVEETHRFFANDILVHNTDSVYFVDPFHNYAYVEHVCKQISTLQREDFNIDIESHDFEIEAKIKRMYFFRNDVGDFVKKLYLYVKDDDHITLKGLPLVKGTCSILGRTVYNKYIKPDVMDGKECKYTIEQVEGWLKTELTLDNIAKRFRVRDADSYKSHSSIQAQIALLYGEGEHYLIPNNVCGAGKDVHYATIEEVQEHGDPLDFLDLRKYLGEVRHFIPWKSRRMIALIGQDHKCKSFRPVEDEDNSSLRQICECRLCGKSWLREKEKQYKRWEYHEL